MSHVPISRQSLVSLDQVSAELSGWVGRVIEHARHWCAVWSSDWDCFFIRIYVFLILMFANYEIRCDTLAANIPSTGTFTVEQSIDLVKQGKLQPSRLNPAARNAILAILRDNDQLKHWANAISAIGVIGKAEDIRVTVGTLNKVHGKLTGKVEAIPTNLLESLALMSAKGIHNARLKLREMILPDYWKKYDFQLSRAGSVLS